MNSQLTQYRYAMFASMLLSTSVNAAINVERINVDSNGNEEIPGVNPTCGPSVCIQGSGDGPISGDGQYVVWPSFGTNLVANDTNGGPDIFVRDRQSGTTTRISLAQDGSELPEMSDTNAPDISADGRYVSYRSAANGIVAEDNNGVQDYFVHDRQTGETVRVSVDSMGQEGDPTIPAHLPGELQLSADGRHVTFGSKSDLTPGDMNVGGGAFVRDLDPGITELVNVTTGGTQPGTGGTAQSSDISSDGQLVLFSTAGIFVANDTNDQTDCLLRNRATGETTRVSLSNTGTQGSDSTKCVTMSSNGRYIVLQSRSEDLVPSDTNGETDIFVRDRVTGETEIVSVASDGTQANQFVHNSARISDDGRFVVFSTSADTLVPGDVLGTTFNDVFLRDRSTDKTYQVNVTQNGWPADANSSPGGISADGKFISFTSDATNIVSGDTNCNSDVFVVEVASIINTAPPVPDGDHPIAIEDNADVIVGSSVTVDVLANDLGLGDAPLTVEIACAPRLGTAIVNADNTITFTAPPQYSGFLYPLRYRVTDVNGEFFTAEVRFETQIADEDGDGVQDSVDACPGTAAGDPVNAQGCSDSQIGGSSGDPAGNLAPSGGGALSPAMLLFFLISLLTTQRKRVYQ